MTDKIVHVAVAVIRDGDGRVLCTQRLPHQHLAGLWEFPGGKVEPGETLAQGLRREIREELGLEVGATAPLLRLTHHYPGKTVMLDTWRVLDWHGVPQGREGQPLRWQHPEAMQAAEFPPADVPIIEALKLPTHYLVTPDLQDQAAVDAFIRRTVRSPIRMIQIRLKMIPSLATDLCAALRRALPAARLLVNSDTLAALPTGAVKNFDGVHLTASALMSVQEKPALFCAASCHSAAELTRAHALGLDFVTLSPVLATASHVQASPLGWAMFSELATGAGLPIYPLGGMTNDMLPHAVRQGAVGIAGIRGLLVD